MIAGILSQQQNPTLAAFYCDDGVKLMIILQGKGVDTINLLYEAGAILLISLACLVIRYRPSSQEDIE